MISKLKLLRMNRGLNQFTVAKAIGIHQTHLSKLENKQFPMTPEILQKLAEFYKVHQSELT